MARPRFKPSQMAVIMSSEQRIEYPRYYSVYSVVDVEASVIGVAVHAGGHPNPRCSTCCLRRYVNMFHNIFVC